MHNLDRMMDNEFAQEYGFINEAETGYANEMDMNLLPSY